MPLTESKLIWWDGNISMIADDNLILIHKNWDLRINQETTNFIEELYCISASESRYEEKIRMFPILSQKWFGTLGFMKSFSFKKSNSDLWNYQIDHMIGNGQSVLDILIDHCQPDTSKSEADETTEQNLNGGRQKQDKIILTKHERHRILEASPLMGVVEG